MNPKGLMNFICSKKHCTETFIEKMEEIKEIKNQWEVAKTLNLNDLVRKEIVSDFNKEINELKEYLHDIIDQIQIIND